MVTPQVCSSPALTCRKCTSPTTTVGAFRSAVVPSPNPPFAFEPQQYAASPGVTAQLWETPALTSTKRNAPAISVRVRRPSRWPSPPFRARSLHHSHWSESVLGRPVAQPTVAVEPPEIAALAGGAAAGVNIARGPAREGNPAGHERRHRSSGGSAITELAIDVGAPAVGQVAARPPTGVVASRVELREARRARDRRRRRAPALSPTVCFPPGREAAGVEVTCADQREAQVAGDPRRRVPVVGRRAVAQLTLDIPSPAVDDVARRDTAGVDPRAYLSEAQTSGHGGRRRPLNGRAIAQLAEVVAAPAIGHVARGDATAVVVASAHLRKAQAAGHGRRLRSLDDRAVAQLAEFVEAPAIDDALDRDPTAVLPTGAHLREPQPAGDGPRRLALGGRAVAQLAEHIVTPAVGKPGDRHGTRVEATGILLHQRDPHAEPGARGRAQPDARRLQDEAVPRQGHAQGVELRDAVPCPDRGGPAQGRAGRIREERDRHIGPGVGDDVPERVLDRHLYRRTEGHLTLRRIGLGNKPKPRCCPGGDGEGNARRGGEGRRHG